MIPQHVRILALLFLVWFTVACDHLESNDPVSAGAENTLHFDVPLAFIPLNPFIQAVSGNNWIHPLIYSSLAIRNADGRWFPDLACSWRYDSSSRSWHIDLRKDARFHDKTMVTADDVIYSIQEALKHLSPQIRSIVDSIQAVTDHSIDIHLTMDHPGFIYKILNTNIIPNKVLLASNFEPTIGSGPYRFNKRIERQKILLTAFDGYYHGAPGIPKIISTHVPSKEQSWSRLLSGETDISVRISSENLRMMKYIKNNYQITQKLSWFIKTLLYNTADPLFSDERVRKALDLCIERQHMVGQILMGFGRVATGPFGVGSPYGNRHRQSIVHDPLKAQALLESAGWELHDADGIRYKDGKSFSFTLLYMNENAINKQVARLIQICFGELGVKVHIKSVTTEKAIRAYFRNTEFQAVLTEIHGIYDEIDAIILPWLPDENGCSNMGCFSSPELTALLTALQSSSQKMDTIKICQAIESKLMKLSPASFLFQVDEVDVVSNRIQLPDQFSSDRFSVHSLYLARIRPSI
jgi:peptide/nickel transport system substrate-binding protein